PEDPFKIPDRFHHYDQYAQDLSLLYGKILRIDVDAGHPGYAIPPTNPLRGGEHGREEIYAWGFRNPWRISFDPETGRLWAGENGEDRFEEIDVVEAGKNYGWKVMEGSACFFPGIGCDMTGLELPVYEYGGTLQRRSVIGGYVYRGKRNPELVGRYIYGDFLVGRIWALDYDGVAPPANEQIAGGVQGVATFGVDEEGELYFSNINDGKIYRFTPTSTGVDDTVRGELVLRPGYPNPFANEARIDVTLRSPQHVRVIVYDLVGRRVRTLVDGVVGSGAHTVTWDGRDGAGVRVSSGAYVYRLESEGAVHSRQIVLVK
ncbi:MAG: PQQ-dependent sugar dehydrogenase, partial [Rhodothermales bacterium]|nr:PQQ-dependent sugar dehydrogenase [Rhodothermales bacterium]